MELYGFRLLPANRKSAINYEQIEEMTSIFTTAANNCTQGVSFKRDGKKISINSIVGNAIELTLYSTTPLPSPTRTLSAFSRELLRLDKELDVLSESRYNHTLFNTEQIDLSTNSEITAEEISDTTLLKSIIDLLYSPTESLEREQVLKAKKQLKEIMLPFIKAKNR